MFCYVYVLGCAAPRGMLTYVGWTTDLERRVAQHNAGTGAKTTRGRVWILLYAERFETPREAMAREWRLKRDRGFRAKLRAELTEPARPSSRRSPARAAPTDRDGP